MSRLNDPENFRGRVNYAAKVIAYGHRPTRAFDSCFENYDSDEVATAILRRSRKNARLAAACFEQQRKADNHGSRDAATDNSESTS